MGKKAEPTPGPWVARECIGQVYFEIVPEQIPSDSGLYQIGHVCASRHGLDGGEHIYGGEQEANAHMLAASRDMYDALVSLREVVRSSLLPAMNEAAKHLPEGHAARRWSVADGFAFQLAAGKADNAIAKADGESND